MVKGFPTRIRTIKGKRITFVRVGGDSDERALFTTKKQAENWINFQMSDVQCRLEKVRGGYNIWAQWRPMKRSKTKKGT